MARGGMPIKVESLSRGRGAEEAPEEKRKVSARQAELR